MLGRPAWYKKLKQQTFKNNIDRFRTNFNPFIGVFRFPSGTNNKSWQKNWVLYCAVIFLIRGTQRHLAAISGGGRRHPRPLDWAGEMVSFSLFREGLDILLLKIKKSKKILFFLLLSWILSTFKQFKQQFSIRKNTYKNFRPPGVLWPK